MKVFQPIVFQGNLRNDKYFEGWYFKQVSENREHVLSFIPGISLTKKDKHAFIQVIDGINSKSWNVRYPLSEFSFAKDVFEIGVGKSLFSGSGIQINIHDKVLKIKGEINFGTRVEYPTGVLSPGIMGWYSFVPFMECKHGIGSVLHRLNGSVNFNSTDVQFTGGTGYIEKDWGTSFPESWIWLHCNTFNMPEVSLTFSVAKIPWLGKFFIGHICFLYVEGKFYRFATYNGSTITKLTYHAPNIEIELKNHSHSLKIKACQNKSGELKAPATGEMKRIIKESIDSDIEVELSDNHQKTIFTGQGSRAGLEIIEKILTYF